MKKNYIFLTVVLALFIGGCTQTKVLKPIDYGMIERDKKEIVDHHYAIKKSMLEKIEREYGIFAKRRVIALVEMMNESTDLDDIGKMEKVNNFFNLFPYESDQKIWNTSDYWATRLEFIGKGKGDCEDFVIAKYFTLKELGIDTSKLYMTYADSLQYKTSHMVLSYYVTPNSIPLLMDNFNYKILPANIRTDIVPIYSFNGDELFNAKHAQIGRMVPASTRQMRPWDELVITK